MLLNFHTYRQLSLTLLICFFSLQLFANSTIHGENSSLFTYQKDNVVFSTNDTLNTTALILNEKLYSKLVNNVSHVSTGGGASLELMSGNQLDAINKLEI